MISIIGKEHLQVSVLLIIKGRSQGKLIRLLGMFKNKMCRD